MQEKDFDQVLFDTVHKIKEPEVEGDQIVVNKVLLIFEYQAADGSVHMGRICTDSVKPWDILGLCQSEIQYWQAAEVTRWMDMGDDDE